MDARKMRLVCAPTIQYQNTVGYIITNSALFPKEVKDTLVLDSRARTSLWTDFQAGKMILGATMVMTVTHSVVKVKVNLMGQHSLLVMLSGAV